MLELKDQPSEVASAIQRWPGSHKSGSETIILDSLPPSDDGETAVFGHFLRAGGETTISYADLTRGAARYAHFFQRQGVRQGEIVLIILRHSPELLYSFLGAMLAGAVPSFIPFPTAKQDPELYWTSHRKLLERIGSGTLLTYSENPTSAREKITDLPWRVLDAGAAVDFSGNFERVSISPDQTAFLQHSSGTTGLKKGVALSHRAVLRQVISYASALKIGPNDRIVSWLPLYHDMGLIACFLLPLITRTPVVMIDPFEWVVNPGLLFSAIKQYRGTLCWQPNFAFHHLCRTVRPSAALDLSSIRAWINCSEPCRADTFQLFGKKFAEAGVKTESLQVCYAMAETVFAVTQTQPGTVPTILTVNPEALQKGRIDIVAETERHQSLLSTGRPISGLHVCIRDEQDQPVSGGFVGEICIAGDCLFNGYFKLENETRRKLRGGWYHSGDLGFLHEGELYVTGRKNDLIIVHGRNYYAHELEHLVNQVAGVHPGRNVATGWFRPEVGSEEVIVIAEAALASGEPGDELITTIKQALLDQAGLLVFDVHLVPAGWLIKTTSGKLSRIENLNKYLAARNAA